MIFTILLNTPAESSEKTMTETKKLELGEFLVSCFTELENIRQLSYRLNTMVIRKYIANPMKSPEKVRILGGKDTSIEYVFESEEKAIEDLDKNGKRSPVDVFFTFFVSLSPEDQEELKTDMIDVLADIAATGL